MIHPISEAPNRYRQNSEMLIRQKSTMVKLLEFEKSWESYPPYSPKNGWLEDYFPIGFPRISFRESNCWSPNHWNSWRFCWSNHTLKPFETTRDESPTKFPAKTFTTTSPGVFEKVHGVTHGLAHGVFSYHFHQSWVCQPEENWNSFDVEGKFGKSSTQNCRRRDPGIRIHSEEGMCFCWVTVYIKRRIKG